MFSRDTAHRIVNKYCAFHEEMKGKRNESNLGYRVLGVTVIYGLVTPYSGGPLRFRGFCFRTDHACIHLDLSIQQLMYGTYKYIQFPHASLSTRDHILTAVLYRIPQRMLHNGLLPTNTRRCKNQASRCLVFWPTCLLFSPKGIPRQVSSNIASVLLFPKLSMQCPVVTLVKIYKSA